MSRAASCALLVLVGLHAAAGCAHRPWEDPGTRWRHVESPHFRVMTDASEADYKAVVDHLEMVHAALSKRFFADVQVPPTDVLLFARKGDYQAVGPKNTAGFFTADGKGNSLIVTHVADETEEMDSIAAHELAHRFITAVSPACPAWLHEGFAMYAGALQLVGDDAVFDARPIVGWYVYFNQAVPFSTLLASNSRDFHRLDDGAHYVTAWMLVRELMSRGGGKTPARLRRLLDEAAKVPAGPGQVAAVERSFEVSLPALEAATADLRARLVSGIGAPTERKAISVQVLDRPGVSRVRPADPTFIKALTGELRASHLENRPVRLSGVLGQTPTEAGQ